MYMVMARNVNEAYVQAARILREYGQLEHSRAGDVLELPRPLVTHYSHPQERVLFDAKRDANPFFHLFESLWMLAGRNDVAFVSQFAQRMAQFSDNGTTFHSAYGHRWRRHFGFDQLHILVKTLMQSPLSRQAYLGIWDPDNDCGSASKDLPCNVGAKFEIRDDRLNMIVFNRSNDMIWGCYGANVVQFSMLQEYLAARLEVRMGWYEQVSGNFHAYLNTWSKAGLDQQEFFETPNTANLYEQGKVKPFPLVRDPAHWDAALLQFLDDPTDFRNPEPFFDRVARPLYMAWLGYKHLGPYDPEEMIRRCEAEDWQAAALAWLLRRTS